MNIKIIDSTMDTIPNGVKVPTTGNAAEFTSGLISMLKALTPIVYTDLVPTRFIDGALKEFNTDRYDAFMYRVVVNGGELGTTYGQYLFKLKDYAG